MGKSIWVGKGIDRSVDQTGVVGSGVYTELKTLFRIGTFRELPQTSQKTDERKRRVLKVRTTLYNLKNFILIIIYSTLQYNYIAVSAIRCNP